MDKRNTLHRRLMWLRDHGSGRIPGARDRTAPVVVRVSHSQQLNVLHLNTSTCIDSSQSVQWMYTHRLYRLRDQGDWRYLASKGQDSPYKVNSWSLPVCTSTCPDYFGKTYNHRQHCRLEAHTTARTSTLCNIVLHVTHMILLTHMIQEAK